MLLTDPKAPVQQNFHGQQPAGCQKVHVEWRSQSNDLGKSRTATMARGWRTSGGPSVDGRRAVSTDISGSVSRHNPVWQTVPCVYHPISKTKLS